MKKKTPKLNPRQALVVKKIVTENKSATKAYKEVYKVQQNSAEANSARMLSKASVRNALNLALRKKGLDEDSIADTLLEIRDNRDWRAKSDFVEKAGKFLGYNTEEPQGASQQMIVNIVDYGANHRIATKTEDS